MKYNFESKMKYELATAFGLIEEKYNVEAGLFSSLLDLIILETPSTPVQDLIGNMSVTYYLIYKYQPLGSHTSTDPIIATGESSTPYSYQILNDIFSNKPELVDTLKSRYKIIKKRKATLTKLENRLMSIGMEEIILVNTDLTVISSEQVALPIYFIHSLVNEKFTAVERFISQLITARNFPKEVFQFSYRDRLSVVRNNSQVYFSACKTENGQLVVRPSAVYNITAGKLCSNDEIAPLVTKIALATGKKVIRKYEKEN